MTSLTRRSLLRSSLGLAASGALARPHLVNAAATTAEVWWTQGFAQEEAQLHAGDRGVGVVDTSGRWWFAPLDRGSGKFESGLCHWFVLLWGSAWVATQG